jgi:hypothetical protein
MDKVANSGNDEFYTPQYAIDPLLKYIPRGKSIWCPFDTQDSFIVKTFKAEGFSVFSSHIQDGHDFFKCKPQGDIVISNPPYSLKTEVFQQLFDLGVTFAMLVGVVGLFESQRRFNMFRDNDFEIMWLNKRVSYFKSYSDQKPSLNPPFSSVWLTKGLLPKGNIFEVIDK